MKKKYNFVWIMVDSVRRHHTTGDDRSRLDFMDEFSKSAVEFKNCVTSAPSTLMSLSASLTGIPAYFLAQNYRDFQFNTDFFFTFNKLLKKNGYNTDRAVIMHPEVRLKLKQFDPLPKQYWPKKYKHIDWFNNRMIFKTLKKSLKQLAKEDIKNPSFWFIDYNCRKDKDISNIVSDTTKLFEDYGYQEDNTVFLISSDHGYPNPNTDITPEYLASKKMSHDVFMTDDNIMIPFLLKYPNCTKGFKVDELISTLDLFPTLIELLSLEVKPEYQIKLHGRSLLDYVNNSIFSDQRFIRTDARWQGQPGRLTAIRSDKHKYVYDHDNQSGELFDISKNDNISPEKIYEKEDYDKVKNVFHEEFIKTENQANKLQLEYLGQQVFSFISKNPKKYKFDFRLEEWENDYIKKYLMDLNVHNDILSNKKIILKKYGSDLDFFTRYLNKCFYQSGRYKDDEYFINKMFLRISEIFKAFTLSKSYWSEERSLIFTFPMYFIKRFLKIPFNQKTNS
ncbi:sulfatase-like hydrolase/transferase [Flavobacteriaceae bacterium]|nr:sulfatase-like hydrolase/transferase [Flavobacteriaceae bacterium]MDC1492904.1 sulfatase-like hydrolase/transferase [Flavobacteriaceae bacterium]